MSLINKLFGRKNDQPGSSSATESTVLQHSNANKVDVNKPVENPNLKVLFEQWRKNRTDDFLNQVFEEIVIRAHFLFVIRLSEEPEPGGDGTATFRKDTIIQFPMLSMQDGKHYYPAFTDWGELAKWESIASPPTTLILSFDDYTDMVFARQRY